MTFRQKIEDHPFTVVAIVAISSFSFGWGVPEALLKVQNLNVPQENTCKVLNDKFDELKRAQCTGVCVSEHKPLTSVTIKKVVLVDTADFNKAYSRLLRENKQTNAHFLRGVLSDFRVPEGVVVEMELIGENQSDAKVVADLKPALVVVHRSTFAPEDHIASDNGIVSLIGKLPAETKILIYSRKEGTNSSYARSIATRSGAAGRVYALKLPEGDAWASYEAVKSVVDETIGLVK